MKKQHTRWIFFYHAAKGTYLKVGWIHNKNKGNRADKLRIRIKSLTCDVDFNVARPLIKASPSSILKTMAVETIAGRIKEK
jgi:hypothetical protein